MKILKLRLMPIVITAAAALLALKVIGLATHQTYMFVQPAAAAGAGHGGGAAKPAAAEGHGPVDAAPVVEKPAEKPLVDARGELTAAPSSEGALNEALSKRREAIDARAADLNAREALLEAAQKRMDDRIAELKRLEQAIADADRKRADEEAGKLKELVILYEGMKPKEAARIFEKLDAPVLLDVASRMKPRTLSVVLGQMAPDAAQKLTVALARREPGLAVADALASNDLPKIEGKPNDR